MKTITKTHLALLAAFSLALIAILPGTVSAHNDRDHGPNRIAVTGGSDWSIIPVTLTPPFFFAPQGDDSVYIRNMPLVGRISLTGRHFALEGRISATLNGELDSTFSGPLWASITLTTTIDGVKTIIFEGNGSGPTVGLISTGVIKLEGRGPYQGSILDLEFAEIGDNTDTYTLKGLLVQRPNR